MATSHSANPDADRVAPDDKIVDALNDVGMTLIDVRYLAEVMQDIIVDLRPVVLDNSEEQRRVLHLDSLATSLVARIKDAADGNELCFAAFKAQKKEASHV